MNPTDLDGLTPREAAARALEWAWKFLREMRPVSQIVPAFQDKAAELRAAPAQGEPVAIYEADTCASEFLMDAEMVKGWRWTRKDFRRGDKLYICQDPRVAVLESALRGLLDRAHPAHVGDEFMREKLIAAREVARAALGEGS